MKWDRPASQQVAGYLALADQRQELAYLYLQSVNEHEHLIALH